MNKRVESLELKGLGISKKALWYIEESDPLDVYRTPGGRYTLEGIEGGTFDTFDELNAYLTGCAEALEELIKEEEEEENK